MNRIDSIFQKLRSDGRKALMPFITAGDPDLATTADLLLEAEQSGASICEVGFPFSDPIADGPVIQASMHRALTSGFKCSALLDTIAQVRPKLSIGLVAMVSFSLMHRQGVEAFAKKAASSGFDGLIVPDLSLEEAGPVRSAAHANGLTLSLLIAPRTPIDRAREIAAFSSGFIYLLSRSGVTGEQSELPPDLGPRIEALRQVSPLPVAVGFGIAKASQVSEVVGVADAAIVGSALVRRLEQHLDDDRRPRVEAVGQLIRELVGGLPQS